MDSPSSSTRPLAARLAWWRRADRTNLLVAADPVTDRALVAVIAILTFIAALTAGAAEFSTRTAARWQVMMASEVTIQVKPQPGRVIDNDLTRAADLLRGTEGVTSVQTYSREDSAKLLEPWLGSLANVEALPLPRLIAVRIDSAKPQDLAALGQSLTAAVPGAVLDDHRSWTRRFSRLADAFLAGSAVALLLVVFAAALAIVFATRGAMAGNRDIIAVLHFVGADDGYIARQFQGHFALLGLRGGTLGGVAALVSVAALRLIGLFTMGNADVLGLSIGAGSIFPGWGMVTVVIAVVILVGVVAGLASRMTVHRTIDQIA
jgi:cell division transport system permease protein